jgi:hypothetical protein
MKDAIEYTSEGAITQSRCIPNVYVADLYAVYEASKANGVEFRDGFKKEFPPRYQSYCNGNCSIPTMNQLEHLSETVDV